ncbi:MAG: hypothetical protein AAF415_14250 [Pseudomonadota bacterium]
MNRRIFLALPALAVLTTAALGVVRPGLTVVKDANKPVIPQGVSLDWPGRVSPPDLLDRPLFIPSRKLTRAPQPEADVRDAPGDVPVAQLVLRGVFVSGSQRSALVTADDGKTAEWLAPGEEIAGATLIAVDTGSAVFELDGGRKRLTIEPKRASTKAGLASAEDP